jgi:uncharacterized membrane protein
MTPASRLLLRRISLIGLSLFFTGAAVLHFVRPEIFLAIVPPWVPGDPLTVVHVSGVFEALGGIGLLLPQTRRLAAWGLALLLCAIFPANIYQAYSNAPVDGHVAPLAFHIIRLPLQAVFVWWAWSHTRPWPPA